MSLRRWLVACAAVGLVWTLPLLVRERPEPEVVVWVWETPTDLRGADHTRVGVAFLARSLLLSGNDLVCRPRLQPLHLDPGTRITAVARFDLDRRTPPTFSSAQEDLAVAALADLADRHRDAAGFQIDFDAPASARPFYGRVLARFRRALLKTQSLSITALASWCQGDPWIRTLPIDDAVPMLFRMGPDARDIRRSLRRGGDFTLASCRSSVGLSADDPFDWHPPGRRVYLFNPGGWTRASVNRALSEFDQ